jgi:UDP-arabinose 4-epimerase
MVEGDLSDRTLLVDTLRKYRIHAVMHFAAFAYVGESVRDPGKYFQNNVSNSINLLDAMVVTGIRDIVFSSSCATYGVPESLPIAEDHPQRPVNPYGESKLFIERALGWYGGAHGIRSSSLRYFNASGADPDGEIGEDHDPETHLIPLVIQAALGQRPHVEVFGTDYPTVDGSAVRDYIHVTDLASAHVRALDVLKDGADSFAVNLGTGHGRSVKEVIAMVEKVSGSKVNVAASPRRPGDPPMLVAKLGLASELLGWTPRYSDLETIIDTTLRWHERQLSQHKQELNA